MPLTNIKADKVCTLERGLVLVRCTLTVGATGAVSAVSGKGFANGAATGEQGGISHAGGGTGDYTITLPGRGGYQALVPLSVQIIDGAEADVRHHRWNAVTPSARTAQIVFSDADTPAPTDPTDGSVIEFVFLVDDSSAS